MSPFPRILAIGVTFLFIAASCGPSTGEGSVSASPAKTQAAAASASPVAAAPKFLVVVGDTIRGKLNLDEQQVLLQYPGIHCTQQSRFPQGQRIVWRMKVIDPTTGKYMDDKQIASFAITFPDGKGDKFVYGEHKGASGSDFLWAVGFTIPIDYPTGAFNYKIEAKSSEGAVGTFDQFKVSFAQLAIVPAENKIRP